MAFAAKAGLTSVLALHVSIIVRLVARLPFDVAADAGFLLFADRFAYQHSIQCGAQVCSGYRNARIRSAIVHLAAIDKRAILVEHIEVRRAGGAVGLGHLLRLVEEIRKGVTTAFYFMHHLLWGIGRMRRRIVRVDAYYCNALRL